MDTRSSQIESSLEKINTAFEEFTSFYGNLIEKGIAQTEYGKTFSEVAQAFQTIYSEAKANYDALMLNRTQFIEGRLERDAYERSLMRNEKSIISADFELHLKVLPYLKKVEKEILQARLKTIEKIDFPEQVNTELKEDAAQIATSMIQIEKQQTFDQLKNYVSTGHKINDFGKKIWKYLRSAAKEVLPIALPAIIRVLGTP